MPQMGYYRYPHISGDKILFCSEDDLWSVEASGGNARRLTANQGAVSNPFFSPDGSLIAFSSREEGSDEVYVMDAAGGPARRMTYLGESCMVIGWVPDGSEILFCSSYGHPFREQHVYSISLAGGLPKPYPVGHAVAISFGPEKRTVICRNNNDAAKWKRYRGGTAGDLWIDNTGNGEFHRLISLKSNPNRPLWIGDRIYFLSDHEGIGNIYSTTPDGTDLTQHTFHKDFYVRLPSTDGKRIVYHAGTDIYVYDPVSNSSRLVEIEYHSPRTLRQRKFVETNKYLESVQMDAKGKKLALTVRGHSFTMSAFEGAVKEQNSNGAPIRYRNTQWLTDGVRTLTVTDVDGVQFLEVHSPNEPVKRLSQFDIGRPTALLKAPDNDRVLIANHRNELLCIDIATETMIECDRNGYGTVRGMTWSTDGRWAAYGFPTNPQQAAIKIWDSVEQMTHTVTEPALHDMEPSFDPDGEYLYFLGTRVFNPMYDALHFDLGFPKGIKPYLIPLKSTTPSPFTLPKSDEEEDKSEKKEGDPNENETEGKAVKPVEIDFTDIAARVTAFPMPEGKYIKITGLHGKVLILEHPIHAEFHSGHTEEHEAGDLHCYDLSSASSEVIAQGVSGFDVSGDGKMTLIHQGDQIRLVKSGSKVNAKAPNEPGRKSGIVDLSRIRTLVDPALEWRQMAKEAWQLQKEFFWVEDMSGVDWDKVWHRYEPLLERVSTRSEFSDLMWEMQGELGTSHAYEFGGDYRKEPSYPIGFLGADYDYHEETNSYLFSHIVQGTAGEEGADSPLRGAGAGVNAGDRLLAINGQRLDKNTLPQELLLNLADTEVSLTIANADGAEREIIVKTLRSEKGARYREWVETNRRKVHSLSNGRLGYLHIPDMMSHGFAEFHRLWMVESIKDGLVVDVRYNGGGHVSQLLLEKLARRPLGYDLTRWGAPEVYPSYSVPGPLVGITNQFAGSDGDIVSHCFKLMKLGTLIGKRTWGGVIGIGPRNSLADGAMTTQPEFSFWFNDVGWGVENYGTDPDIDIDITPQDYANGRDPQLDKAIEVALQQLETNPPQRPTFADRPKLTLPY